MMVVLRKVYSAADGDTLVIDVHETGKVTVYARSVHGGYRVELPVSELELMVNDLTEVMVRARILNARSSSTGE